MLQAVKLAIKQVAERRSSKWPSVRREHLRSNPACVVCGAKKKVEVHHIVPVSVDRDRELDPINLVTLCETSMRCHFIWGHLGRWKSFNASVLEDAKSFALKLLNRP